MEQKNEQPPSVRADIDVMDVSPTANPDSTPPADDNKENDDADIEPTPLLAPVSHPNHPPLADPVAPPLAPTAGPPQQQTSTAPSAHDDDIRDTQFTYVLRKYDSITETRVHSPWHVFGGFKWRLLIFPRGNQSSNHDLSVYLECGGPSLRNEYPRPAVSNHTVSPNGKEAVVTALPPTAWTRPAKFSLHLVHPSSPIAKAATRSDALLTDPSFIDVDISESNLSTRLSSASNRADLVKETSHIFRHNVSDWGFLEFAPFSSLQPNGYADEEMNVVIMVKIKLQDPSVDPTFSNAPPWDSRKETGLVGFKNQGATCYMNSLLQTLYMLSAFRKAVYNMPLPEHGNKNSRSELSYALQKVFYELQFSPTVVKTKKLTESFGWDTTDAFTQHDVQELKLILCDELAEKMKEIAPDQPNTLSTLFQGKLLNYIECVNVPYKSTREEEFSDLSLNVKGCQNIYDSFDKYIEVEMMEGDNKYRADGFDELQDAKKGVKFLKLPPVLLLHLKRFEYDTARNAMIKINDRYEFDSEINLSRFVEESANDDVYVLHSVLVHIGDVNGGHYHAFIRPDIDTSENLDKKPSQWFKFDDENVTPVGEENAIQDNFGFGGEKEFARRGIIDDDLSNGGEHGQTPPPPVFPNRNRNYQPRRYSNAYMLQYLRKSDVHYLLSRPKDEDVPKDLSARIRKEHEEEEQRKRDNTEQHLYMSIAVATDDDMVQHHGSDLVNWEKVRTLRVKRATQLRELKLQLQSEGIAQDASRMRLWKCTGRQNQTIRPDSLVAGGDDSQPIDSNYRDSMAQGGFNVPVYNTRHMYYGQEEILRLYVEDLCSKFCLSAGKSYSKFLNGVDVGKDSKLISVQGAAEKKSQEKEKMDTESSAIDDVQVSFPLKPAQETLLFLKYYSSTPSPRLQWLGHFVVDRRSTVQDLKPILRRAVESFRRQDGSLSEIGKDDTMRVFEEVCASSVKELEEAKTLEQHGIPCEGGNGDIIVFQCVKRRSVGGNGEENKGGRIANGKGVNVDLKTCEEMDELEWDGHQEVSRGDGTDLPLGGRPLPLVTMFFDYLVNRIKIEFKERPNAGLNDDSSSIFFELSRRDTYRTARRVLCGALGKDVNADYVRFFPHDFNRDGPAHESFRNSSDVLLERLVSVHSLLSTGQPEYRIIWYERTEYHISEFEEKEEVRVMWRADGGTRSTGCIAKGSVVSGGGNGPFGNSTCGTEFGNVGVTHTPSSGTDMSIDGDEESKESGVFERESFALGEEKLDRRGGVGREKNVGDEKSGKAFSVLVGNSAKYGDVIEEVRMKLQLDKDVELRMMEVKGHRIERLIEEDEKVPAIVTGCHDYGTELRVEPVAEDETREALGDEYIVMAVVHLEKEKAVRTWRGPTFFGEPFVIKVRRSGESVTEMRRRIQEKIGVADDVFEAWGLAEIAQMKAVMLEEGTVYQPRVAIGMEFCTLAIEHKNTTPAKRTPSGVSRYADKPLKIRS